MLSKGTFLLNLGSLNLLNLPAQPSETRGTRHHPQKWRSAMQSSWRLEVRLTDADMLMISIAISGSDSLEVLTIYQAYVRLM